MSDMLTSNERSLLRRARELLGAFRHAYEPNNQFPLLKELDTYLESEPDPPPKLPAFIRRDIERAIEDAINPRGMSTGDGKARIGVDRLQYLMRMLDGASGETPAALDLEWLESMAKYAGRKDDKAAAAKLLDALRPAQVKTPCSAIEKEI